MKVWQSGLLRDNNALSRYVSIANFPKSGAIRGQVEGGTEQTRDSSDLILGESSALSVALILRLNDLSLRQKYARDVCEIGDRILLYFDESSLSFA